ncbi:MAG: GNAT family N-acetyltransferase [Isosphaeraceae bacterium]|nr:GNAT family N-acetyltransferase [Isosphaeraceae bacterium]
MKTILQTRRLVLREMAMTDLEFVAEQLADPDVMRYWPRPHTREEAEAWVRRQQERYARDGFGYWLALDGATRHPIGQVGLLAHEVDGRAEVDLGWIIHRPFWRLGYATEGGAACRDLAFRTLDVPRVIALVRPENVPSQGVARKLGMRPVSRTVFAGLDHWVFEQTREDALL